MNIHILCVNKELLVPKLEWNNTLTLRMRGKVPVTGLVVYDTTEQERNEILEVYANSSDLNTPPDGLKWVELTPK